MTEGASNELLADLVEWLRIPSISSGGGRSEDLMRAAEWAAERIEAAGGSSEIRTEFGNPLVVGELRAGRPGAPTLLIYGHYDVQSPDPVEAWTTPPFEPTVRGGRLYARGASDDKGNFLPLLHVACEFARRGELPVNVRVLIEGEEETAGVSAIEWLARDERGADCAVVFDSDMLDESTPALTLGARGIVMCHVEVHTANGDVHSGMYGGSVLNAVHVLHRVLAQVLPGDNGRVRDELRAGIIAPTAADLEAWAQLPAGDDVLASVGGRPLYPAAGAEYYQRNWADASVDVHGVEGGDARQVRTMIPATARAKVSIRLAPGQSTAVIAPIMTTLLWAAAPAGAEVEASVISVGEPVVFDPELPALRLAARALERACGRAPALTRVGGSLPILAAFADRRIPAIVSGFALAQDAIHAADESFRLESLRLGEVSARELYRTLADLPTES